MQIPTQPPEAKLIEELRQAVRPKLSVRKAAELAGMSEGRWRQIAKGYNQLSKDTFVPSIAPAETLARMAQVVGATDEHLREVGRDDAADELVALNRTSAKQRLDHQLQAMKDDSDSERAEAAASEFWQERGQLVSHIFGDRRQIAMDLLGIAESVAGVITALAAGQNSRQSITSLRSVSRRLLTMSLRLMGQELGIADPTAPGAIDRLRADLDRINAMYSALDGLDQQEQGNSDDVETAPQPATSTEGNEVQEVRSQWGDGGPFYVVRMTNGPRKGETRVVNQAEFDNPPVDQAFDVMSTIPAGTKVSFGDLPIGFVTPEMQELIDAAIRKRESKGQTTPAGTSPEGGQGQEAGDDDEVAQSHCDLAARTVDDDKPGA